MPTIPVEQDEKTAKYSRADMAADVAEITQKSKAFSRTLVDMLFNKIAEALIRGENVDLGEVGTLKVKTRKARMGRNPRTGEPLPIPEHRVVCLVTGKRFERGALNAKG